MAKPILDDELWALIEPHLPPPKPRRFRYHGRKPIDNRRALTGILFVLITGIPWEKLPKEMGCGSGMTCWRRLRDWAQAGVWTKIHHILLAHLRGADKIDWSRAVIDSASVRADDFRNLVRAIAQGKEPDADRVERVLSDTGKSLDDLRAVVKLYKRRFTMKTQVNPLL
ncbi:MAG: transposase, partial [Gemmatales bacterium]|nr:transposase [Gemmatales bacterium]MDW8388312.1 transposase [Gemmatales bacterium]